MYTRVHVYMYIHVYVYTYTYKHIYIYTHIYRYRYNLLFSNTQLSFSLGLGMTFSSLKRRPWAKSWVWRYETNSHWELSLGTCPETISLKNGRRIRKFLLASFKCPNKLGLTRIQIHQTYPKMVRHLSLWLSGLTNRSRVNRHQLEICSCKYIVLYSYIIYILQYDWIGLWSLFFCHIYWSWPPMMDWLAWWPSSWTS